MLLVFFSTVKEKMKKTGKIKKFFKRGRDVDVGRKIEV